MKMRRTWLLPILLLTIVMLFSACADKKASVTQTVDTLFSLLRRGQFTEADAYFLPAQGDDAVTIPNTAFTRALFAGIEAKVWRAEGDEAELCITQKSMHRVYMVAMEKTAGISMESDAGKQLWANAVAEAMNETTETAVFVVTVPLVRENGTLRFRLTDELLNALYGGELDALNTFEKIGEKANG